MFIMCTNDDLQSPYCVAAAAAVPMFAGLTLSWQPVLLVDDNPLDVELTLLALQDQGLSGSVAVVQDGVDALAYLERSGVAADGSHRLPQLMLLDLHMPRLDGHSVLRRVRATQAWQALRVVMLTTSDDPQDRRRCLEAGADGYVLKSLELNSFVQSMREVTRAWLPAPS
jgi:two-component system, chemotaxis family, response regulator Rcp1